MRKIVKAQLALVIILSTFLLLFTSVTGYAKTVTKKQLTAAIMKATSYLDNEYSKSNYKGLLDWPAVALFSAGEDLKSGKWRTKAKSGIVWRKSEVKDGVDFDSERATDYHRTLLGVLASGENPKSFAGRNLITAIKKSQMPNGKFADTINKGGLNLVNSHVWAIISLYAAGEEVPDKDKAFKWLISHQNADGGFSIDTEVRVSDIDMTGMALAAFGSLGKSYKDKNVEKALKYLKSQQLTNGGFQIWGVENPESAASVVQGLIAIGVDPSSKRWTQGSGMNPINFIMSFQLSDGAFKHEKSGEADITATYKCLMAISDFKDRKTVFKKLREKRK